MTSPAILASCSSVFFRRIFVASFPFTRAMDQAGCIHYVYMPNTLCMRTVTYNYCILLLLLLQLLLLLLLLLLTVYAPSRQKARLANAGNVERVDKRSGSVMTKISNCVCRISGHLSQCSTVCGHGCLTIVSTVDGVDCRCCCCYYFRILCLTAFFSEVTPVWTNRTNESL